MTHEADCHVKFLDDVPLLPKDPACLLHCSQAHLDTRALTAMPSLSPRRPFHRPFSWYAKRLPVAVAALTGLVALSHVRAATPPAAKTASTVAAAPPAPTPAPPAKKGKAPTCQAIMQRLSGSLAGTPSNTDKPGAVLVDVDKAGVTMACSHSDAVAIPVPGNSKTR